MPSPLGVVTPGVSLRQLLQQLLQESQAALCPWAWLSSPTQTVCARIPGPSLSPGWSSTSTHRDTLPLSPLTTGTVQLVFPGHLQPHTSSVPVSQHRACRAQPDPSPGHHLQQADVLSPALQEPQSQGDACPVFPSGHPKNPGECGTPLEVSAKHWDVRTIPSGCHHSLQGISCMVTWPPAFHPLQQGHCLRVLSLWRSHMDFFALSHNTTSQAEPSAGCTLEEQRIIESFR